jgi:hypothetical protein
LHLPTIDLRTELIRILGVDLTEVPGLESATVYTLVSELGTSLSAFPTHKHFCSWLGLCPDNRVSGGRVLSTHTRKVKSRVATALRIAVQSLHRSQSSLGAYYRRMRARMGPAKATTAAAHKLARILYVLVTTGQPYTESAFAEADALSEKRRLARLHRDAASLGFQLTPAATALADLADDPI